MLTLTCLPPPPRAVADGAVAAVVGAAPSAAEGLIYKVIDRHEGARAVTSLRGEGDRSRSPAGPGDRVGLRPPLGPPGTAARIAGYMRRAPKVGPSLPGASLVIMHMCAQILATRSEVLPHSEQDMVFRAVALPGLTVTFQEVVTPKARTPCACGGGAEHCS